MAEQNAASKGNIVIKKVKKGGHGHHGGAWKLAYADFVTAMMAFFLLLWLIGNVDVVTRRGIAEYFKDPWKPSFAGGKDSGDRSSLIPGGGTDITQQDGTVKECPPHTEEGDESTMHKEYFYNSNLTQEQKEELARKEEEEEQLSKKDQQRLESLKGKMMELVETSPLLNQFKDQLIIDFTKEGLRVQILDKEKRPMFDLASARLEPYAAQILDKIAPLINELPNRISISGHTDGRPFPGGNAGYSNWELSTDRANAARRELNHGGLREDKMMRVVGLASSVPFNKQDNLDPVNRRISIIVLNHKTEAAILDNGTTAFQEESQTDPRNTPATPVPASPAPAAPAPASAPPASTRSSRPADNPLGLPPGFVDSSPGPITLPSPFTSPAPYPPPKTR